MIISASVILRHAEELAQFAQWFETDVRGTEATGKYVVCMLKHHSLEKIPEHAFIATRLVTLHFIVVKEENGWRKKTRTWCLHKTRCD